MAKNILALGISIIFSIISVLPLLHPGLHPTHDGEYHVIRFYEFDKVLRDGSIYPRWAPDLNNGYGVPLFNYVYPLPNYAASLLHAFGLSFIDSFKLQMFIASIMGSFFFYLWSKRYWGILGGIVSATLYIYSPYRFVDIYIRGSVGEVWAISLFPVLLYTTDKYFEKRTFLYIASSAILLSFIIFSHNILGLLFFIFYVTYVAYVIYVTHDRKIWIRNLRSFLFVLLLGLGLSAIFWLPALLEEKYVTGLQIYNVANNFPELYQLIIPSWGTGFFNSGNLGNQMSVQIGIMNIIGVILGIIILSFPRKRESGFSIKSRITFFLVWFFLVIFLMLSVSRPIWELVPFMKYFQFPWRLLSIVVIVAPFLAGSIFTIGRIGQKLLFAVFLTALSVVLAIGYTKPAYYHNRTDQYYIARDNFIHGTNSPGNLFNTIWMNNGLSIANEKVSILQDKTDFAMLEDKSAKLSFSVNALESTKLSIAKAYFPGWNVYIDGKKTSIRPDNSGLISLSIPRGKHYVEAFFEDTLIRKVSAILSSLSFISILAFLFRNRYRKTYESRY